MVVAFLFHFQSSQRCLLMPMMLAMAAVAMDQCCCGWDMPIPLMLAK
jgi:hypothetical protein